jgi:23S rRNA (guanosine2251-2'-O)-methyltransferase
MRKPPPKKPSFSDRSSSPREDRRLPSGRDGRDGGAPPRSDDRAGGRPDERGGRREQRSGPRNDHSPGNYRPPLNERPASDRFERSAPSRGERPAGRRDERAAPARDERPAGRRDERTAFIRGERSGPPREARPAPGRDERSERPAARDERPAARTERSERPDARAERSEPRAERTGVRAERGPDNRPNPRTAARQQALAEGRIGPHGEARAAAASAPADSKSTAVRALAPASADRPGLPPVKGDRLEGRNVVYEALVRGRRTVRTVWMDLGAKSDDKIDQILALAGDRVKRVERAQLDRMSLTGVHNGVIAEADELVEPTVRQLLGAPEPFLVLVDEVQYEHNLGAVLRSALGAGVDGVIIPTQRGKGLTPVVQRVSMGGAEAVPVVRAGISASLAEIQRAGVRVIGADMNGTAPWDLDLTGPIAFVLGGEDKGLTAPVRKRCDAIAGIPLMGDLQSLNVSVTAGILLFERVRQMAALAKRNKG